MPTCPLPMDSRATPGAGQRWLHAWCGRMTLSLASAPHSELVLRVTRKKGRLSLSYTLCPMVSSRTATLRTTFLGQLQSQVPGCELHQSWAFSVLFTVCVPDAQNSAHSINHHRTNRCLGRSKPWRPAIPGLHSRQRTFNPKPFPDLL